MLKRLKLQLEKFKTKLKKKKDNFSQNAHNHYLFQLPDNIGLLSTFILKLFFSGIKVAEEQTHNLKKTSKRGDCYICY